MHFVNKRLVTCYVTMRPHCLLFATLLRILCKSEMIVAGVRCVDWLESAAQSNIYNVYNDPHTFHS